MFIFKIGNFLLLWLTLKMISDRTRQQQQKRKKGAYSTEIAIKLRLNTLYGLIIFPFLILTLFFFIPLLLRCYGVVNNKFLLQNNNNNNNNNKVALNFNFNLSVLNEYTRSYQVSIQNWCVLLITFSI